MVAGLSGHQVGAERQAIVDLIVTAPELLDALEELARAYEFDTQFIQTDGDVLAQANAAIAKARGQNVCLRRLPPPCSANPTGAKPGTRGCLRAAPPEHGAASGPRIWTADECKRVTDCYYAGATMRSISKAMGILSEAVIAASTAPCHHPAQVEMQRAYWCYRDEQARQHEVIDAALAALRECVGQVAQ